MSPLAWGRAWKGTCQRETRCKLNVEIICLVFLFYSWFHVTFPWMLRTSFRTSLWSSKVHNEIHKPVCKEKSLIGLFLLRDQSEALFTNRLVNFSMNFWTSQRSLERSSQHSRKSYVKSTVNAVNLSVYNLLSFSGCFLVLFSFIQFWTRNCIDCCVVLFEFGDCRVSESHRSRSRKSRSRAIKILKFFINTFLECYIFRICCQNFRSFPDNNLLIAREIDDIEIWNQRPNLMQYCANFFRDISIDPFSLSNVSYGCNIHIIITYFINFSTEHI
jgi:hypothetical protein